MTARFDPSGPAVVVDHLDLHDPAVVAEARRWSTGHRAAAVSADEMAGADLTAFVTRAVVVGSHAIATAGGAQEAYNLEALVTEVGERTAEASRQVTRATDEAIRKATTSIESSTAAARTAIGELGAEARRAFSENVDAAGKALSGEVNRLLGGEHPELLARLAPVIERFGRELETRSTQQTSELIAKAARQFDPADPASPMAQQARTLAEQQQSLGAALAKDNTDLARKVDELVEIVKLAQAASGARSAVVRSSTLKGEQYAQAMHPLLGAVAAGLGDEYVDVSAVVGLLSRNRKGDGVLAILGGDARIAVEMSDSSRGAGWASYLEEAERNRGAIASLGLVRTAEQLGGAGVVSLGTRRIVLAFDPDSDHPDLLRTVVQLLRISAQAASMRDDAAEVRTAEEKLDEALTLLTQIDTISKLAGQIRQNATKIDTEADGVKGKLTRLLSQARAALTSARTDDVAA